MICWVHGSSCSWSPPFENSCQRQEHFFHLPSQDPTSPPIWSPVSSSSPPPPRHLPLRHSIVVKRFAGSVPPLPLCPILRVDLTVGCRCVLVLHHVRQIRGRTVRSHVQVLKVARFRTDGQSKLDGCLRLGRVHGDAVRVQRVVVLHQHHVLAEQVLVARFHLQDA